MALIPSDPAQQKRLLIGILPLLLLFGYWYFLHSDYTVEVEEMQARLTNLEAVNSRSRMAAAQSGQLEERLQQFERHIRRLEQLVPRSEEVAELMDQINQSAEQVGVTVASFAPGQTDRGTHYNRRTFEITVRGHYHNIARFLTEIGSLPRIVTPVGLSLIPNNLIPSREPGQVLEASFDVETYVLPDTDSRQAATGGPSAGA